MRPKRWTLAAVALILALATVGTGTALAQVSPQADLRAFHAVPGASGIDVFVDGNLIFSNVQFKQATNYAALPAGQHTVRVVPSGAGAQGQALISTTVNLGAESFNTLAAVGQPTSFQPLVLTNSSTLPPTTQSRVRAVNASPDAPAVDVAVPGGPVLFTNVSFPSASDYTVIDAGTINLEIRQAGTSNVLKSVPNVTLNGATVDSIFVVGLTSGQPPLETVVVVDAPPVQTCQILVGARAAATLTNTPTPTNTPTFTPTSTATPRVTSTPPTGTPPVTGTPRTGTPLVTGTPQTRTPSATPRTGTPQATPQTATPQVSPTSLVTGTASPGTSATSAGTPLMGATPQGTMPMGGGTLQRMSIMGRGRGPAPAVLQVGLSLAAVLGGLAFSRRLF